MIGGIKISFDLQSTGGSDCAQQLLSFAPTCVSATGVYIGPAAVQK